MASRGVTVHITYKNNQSSTVFITRFGSGCWKRRVVCHRSSPNDPSVNPNVTLVTSARRRGDFSVNPNVTLVTVASRRVIAVVDDTDSTHFATFQISLADVSFNMTLVSDLSKTLICFKHFSAPASLWVSNLLSLGILIFDPKYSCCWKI